MKSTMTIIAVLAALSLAGSRSHALHEVGVEFEISAVTEFHEPLVAYGEWVDVEPYGRCWRPGRVTVEWRPYCDGYWVWTDCGWYWVSDEPWAWACYHYGRWVLHPRYRWVWVPDIDWGPAWVSWRWGGGYCGWAPLYPGIVFSGGAIVAAQVNIEPSLFIFVGVDRFRERHRPSTVIVNDINIVNKTVNITQITRVERSIGGGGRRQVAVNEGPAREEVAKATGQEVAATPIHEAVQREAKPPPGLKRKAATQEGAPTEPGAQSLPPAGGGKPEGAPPAPGMQPETQPSEPGGKAKGKRPFEPGYQPEAQPTEPQAKRKRQGLPEPGIQPEPQPAEPGYKPKRQGPPEPGIQPETPPAEPGFKPKRQGPPDTGFQPGPQPTEPEVKRKHQGPPESGFQPGPSPGEVKKHLPPDMPPGPGTAPEPGPRKSKKQKPPDVQGSLPPTPDLGPRVSPGPPPSPEPGPRVSPGPPPSPEPGPGGPPSGQGGQRGHKQKD